LINWNIVTMTNWQPNLEGRAAPRYQAISDSLADDISTGTLKPGDRLPPQRDLAWRLGVTVGTVTRAYAEAERRGLVSGEVGRGTYVRRLNSHPESLDLSDEIMDSNFVHLANAFPAPIGITPFRDVLSELSQDPKLVPLLGYLPSGGLKEHRAAAAAWLQRSGVKTSQEQVAITVGAQQATVVALSAITRPGDRLLVENQTWPGIMAIADHLNLRLEGLAMDEYGLLPEALETACRSNDAKALYTIPTLQNPTNTIMPLERREQIAEVTRKHDIQIVEDDVFGLLAENPPPPIQTLAPDRTFFVTGLAKTLAPGLRTGFIAWPEDATPRIARSIRAFSWMSPPLTSEMAARLIQNGCADQVLTALKHEGEARRKVTLDRLSAFEVDCPEGAIFAWLHLPEPWRSSEFAEQARKKGVLIKAAETFNTGREIVCHAVRLCFGQPRDHENLNRGLTILCDLLREGPLANLEATI